jgi:gluconate 5-dehydrogenase
MNENLAPDGLPAFAPSMFDIRGKVAIITGAGRGLGRAITFGLAAQGVKVFLAGRNEDVLAQTGSELEDMGAEVGLLSTDVSREEDVLALRDAALDRFGHIDVLVNNAGINPYYLPADRTDLAQWQELINVNLTGVFLCCRHIGPTMFEAGGVIINISSIAGQVGLGRAAAYCASKGGVEMLTRDLAIDWARHKVRVNCIAPGFFGTELTAGIQNNPHLRQKILAQTLLGRMGQAQDIAGAAVFLASPAAAYMTGQTLNLDGGWLAR